MVLTHTLRLKPPDIQSDVHYLDGDGLSGGTLKADRRAFTSVEVELATGARVPLAVRLVDVVALYGDGVVDVDVLTTLSLQSAGDAQIFPPGFRADVAKSPFYIFTHWGEPHARWEPLDMFFTWAQLELALQHDNRIEFLDGIYRPPGTDRS